MDAQLICGVAFAGAIVGFASGVFGIGGGFLLVPVLNIALRVPIEFAVGAGACQVLGPATTSLLARRVELNDLRLPLILSGGLLAGVLAGASTLDQAERTGTIAAGVADHGIPLAEFSVLLAYFVLLTSLGIFALFEVRRSAANQPLRAGWMARWRVPPYTAMTGSNDPQLSIPILTWFGLAVGFVSGFLGMSGGLILFPGLIYLIGMPTQRAVIGTLVIVWLVAVQSTIAHAWHNHIDLKLVAALLVGGTIGARLGSEFGPNLRGRQVRYGYACVVLLAGFVVGIRLLYLVV